jgi:hypothetical protein
VRAICEALSTQEGVGHLEPGQVLSLRRYGIFGIPELLRQIKRRNSEHAFAAALAILQQRGLHGNYLDNPAGPYTNKDAKLRAIVEFWQKMKATGPADLPIIKQVEAEIAAN